MISYAGVTLLSDASIYNGKLDRSLYDFLESRLPLQQLFATEPGPARSDWAWAENREYFENAPSLNTLYWPSGARRWAMGFFLADKSRAEQIVAQAAPEGRLRAESLIIGNADEEDEHVEALMFLLPPVPLALQGGDDDAELFLIVLVDERFYWRYVNVAVAAETITDGSVPQPLEWGGLIGTASTAIGDQSIDLINDDVIEPIEFSDIEDAYLKAEPTLLDHNIDAAQLLDIVAENTGRVVVRDYDGKSHLLIWEESEVRHQESANKDFKRMAGLDAFAPMAFPDQAPAFFPEKYRLRHPVHHSKSGRFQKYDSRPNDVGGSFGYFTAADTVWGLSLADSNQLDNDEDIARLTEKLTADFKARWKFTVDATFAGIVPWQPNGYADMIEFHHRRQACYTRVRSAPWNSIPRNYNHWHPDSPLPLGDIAMGELVDGTQLTRFGGTGASSAQVDILANEDPNAPTGPGLWVKTGDIVTAHEGRLLATGVQLQGGTRVVIEKILGQWVYTGLDCDKIN